ncbi:DNA polymerase III subunit delta' [Halalkalibacter akibai]|uniref:DNA polymerase III subunit delta' n=1 Tax=Halalkalibacter akibai (strain ATCC 43226 / DSM 21942 / CIP 109018 / JCM 9157 / 1139) TaxID=1236973 RepID=W4QWS9_HALA3|nr:DNA polymerase III subunit delta' [Halalkalibacter akibai]GAE36546.1 DNA polymerase III delta prime subunit [Halalkalibacter akibai JCM 9157]
METWEQLKDTQPKIINLLVRTLEKNRLAHAYLFEGSKGTGKKKVALQLAKSFFCGERQGSDPCMECRDCKRIEHGNHPDVHIIDPDGQSIKKHQVEHLQKEFSYRGVESAKKVYIVSHADLMTVGAANSILKFLEEPAAETLAILLTEQGSKVLPTIHSRSQHLTFAPLLRGKFIDILVEDGNSNTIATMLASLTTSYEETLQLLEGDWIAQARTVVIQLMEETYSRPSQVLFTVQEKWIPLFKEKSQQEIGLDMILLWLRDLMYMKVGKLDSLTYVDQQNKLEQQALNSTQDVLSRRMSAVLQAKKHLASNVNPQLLMEKLLLTIQEG